MIKRFFNSLPTLFLLLFSVSVFAMNGEDGGLRSRASKAHPPARSLDCPEKGKKEVYLHSKPLQKDDAFFSYLIEKLDEHILSLLSTYDLVIMGHTSKYFQKKAKAVYRNKFEFYNPDFHQFHPYSCAILSLTVRPETRWPPCSPQALLIAFSPKKKPYFKLFNKAPVEVTDNTDLLSSLAPALQKGHVKFYEAPPEKEKKILQLAVDMDYLSIPYPRNILMPEEGKQELVKKKQSIIVHSNSPMSWWETWSYRVLCSATATFSGAGGCMGCVLFNSKAILSCCPIFCWATYSLCRAEYLSSQTHRIFTSCEAEDLLLFSDQNYLLSGKLVKEIMVKAGQEPSRLTLGCNEFTITNINNNNKPIHDRQVLIAEHCTDGCFRIPGFLSFRKIGSMSDNNSIP